MIQVDLITGFLGAGKTSFLMRYAKYLLSKGQKPHPNSLKVMNQTTEAHA